MHLCLPGEIQKDFSNVGKDVEKKGAAIMENSKEVL